MEGNNYIWLLLTKHRSMHKHVRNVLNFLPVIALVNLRAVNGNMLIFLFNICFIHLYSM